MLWRSMQISEGLPRFQKSLFRCKFARKGRREGENGREGASPLFFLLPPSPFPWSLALCHSSVTFRFALAFVRDQSAKKNELPEEEEVCSPYHVKAKFICYLSFFEAYNIFSSTSRWFLGRFDFRLPLSWLRSCSIPRRYLGLTPSEQRAASNRA